MQPEMLKIIHSSHLGMEKCKHLARDILYWPGICAQIEDFVSTCSTITLEAILKNHSSLTVYQPVHGPNLVVTYVGGDLFELQRKYYLILVDHYSGFVEINHLHNHHKQSSNHSL